MHESGSILDVEAAEDGYAFDDQSLGNWRSRIGTATGFLLFWVQSSVAATAENAHCFKHYFPIGRNANITATEDRNHVDLRLRAQNIGLG
jgi:hypothetical protein